MIITDWANDWAGRIPPEAVADLLTRLGTDGAIVTKSPKRPNEGASENYVQSSVRLEASEKDVLLWRNNVGVLKDERGVPVRYGLANDSKQVNEVLKSSDLIGIRKHLIRPQDVGYTVGRFVARECKHGAWVRTPGDEHEDAQQNFGDLILSYGGDFAFATGRGTL